MLETLETQPPDPLLALIGMYRDDPRTDKIDLGVGVYRDEAGRTPVMTAVKSAEYALLKNQQSKSYLGPEGDPGFVDNMARLVLGKSLHLADSRITGVQTPGGTGALRLGFELVRRAHPDARIIVGRPTWANHEPIIGAVGLEVAPYDYLDVASQRVKFEQMVDAVHGARAGDVLLLHGCCHNPTGADLSLEQWADIAEAVSVTEVVPFIDVAYLGLGQGIDEDAAGLRLVAESVPEALVSVSCSKSFGLYRERTGALLAVGPSAASLTAVQTNLLSIARANYSMPPDHGAAVVRAILNDPTLTAEWRGELSQMRNRIDDLRQKLSTELRTIGLSGIEHLNGMFSMLPLNPDSIRQLRDEHGIYMAGNGRINVAGLGLGQSRSFAEALRRTMAVGELTPS